MLQLVLPASEGERAGLDEPADGFLDGIEPAPAEAAPTESIRRELWQAAGLTRSAAELETLLDSPSLIARLVAASALVRTESRRVPFRSDYPAADPELDGMEVIVSRDAPPRLERWQPSRSAGPRAAPPRRRAPGGATTMLAAAVEPRP